MLEGDRAAAGGGGRARRDIEYVGEVPGCVVLGSAVAREGATAPLALDPALRLQPCQRPANRGPRDAIIPHEPWLARQWHTGADPPFGQSLREDAVEPQIAGNPGPGLGYCRHARKPRWVNCIQLLLELGWGFWGEDRPSGGQVDTPGVRQGQCAPRLAGRPPSTLKKGGVRFRRISGKVAQLVRARHS